MLLQVSPEDLSVWENEGHEFKLTELREVARRYKRPLVALIRKNTVIPVGTNFESGRTYTVVVNEITETFAAQ